MPTEEVGLGRGSPHVLDEDALLVLVKQPCDDILTQNESLLEHFTLPSKLRGNLLLIMYLLDSTLTQIYEKLKAPTR
mgnify:CR=1 FL=1